METKMVGNCDMARKMTTLIKCSEDKAVRNCTWSTKDTLMRDIPLRTAA